MAAVMALFTLLFFKAYESWFLLLAMPLPLLLASGLLLASRHYAGKAYRGFPQ